MEKKDKELSHSLGDLQRLQRLRLSYHEQDKRRRNHRWGLSSSAIVSPPPQTTSLLSSWKDGKDPTSRHLRVVQEKDPAVKNNNKWESTIGLNNKKYCFSSPHKQEHQEDIEIIFRVERKQVPVVAASSLPSSASDNNDNSVVDHSTTVASLALTSCGSPETLRELARLSSRVVVTECRHNNSSTATTKAVRLFSPKCTVTASDFYNRSYSCSSKNKEDDTRPPLLILASSLLHCNNNEDDNEEEDSVNELSMEDISTSPSHELLRNNGTSCRHSLFQINILVESQNQRYSRGVDQSTHNSPAVSQCKTLSRNWTVFYRAAVLIVSAATILFFLIVSGGKEGFYLGFANNIVNTGQSCQDENSNLESSSFSPNHRIPFWKRGSFGFDAVHHHLRQQHATEPLQQSPVCLPRQLQSIFVEHSITSTEMNSQSRGDTR